MRGMAKEHPCRKFRKAKRITQEEYADLLGISHQRVSQIERDEWPPGRELITRIVANSEGHISLGEMFEWIEKAQKRKARAKARA